MILLIKTSQSKSTCSEPDVQPVSYSLPPNKLSIPVRLEK